VSIGRALSSLGLAVLIACSGGGPKAAGKFSPTPKASLQGGQAAQQTPLGKLKPPSTARLWAGTASVVGQLTHYCKGSTCEDVGPRTPPFVKAEERTFVLFTIGSAPLSATAEIRRRASDPPSTVTLDPGSSMVFDHDLGPGRYLIDLSVRWRTSEARWRFGMTLT
jgi:hypothetical protein